MINLLFTSKTYKDCNDMKALLVLTFIREYVNTYGDFSVFLQSVALEIK